jgi:hypothetical protein
LSQHNAFVYSKNKKVILPTIRNLQVRGVSDSLDAVSVQKLLVTGAVLFDGIELEFC